jgi:hypothetical protein
MSGIYISHRRKDSDAHAQRLVDALSARLVEWEWRRALALKGLDAMQIHPLENGVKPPPELGALHFGSVAMYARGPS